MRHRSATPTVFHDLVDELLIYDRPSTAEGREKLPLRP